MRYQTKNDEIKCNLMQTAHYFMHFSLSQRERQESVRLWLQGIHVRTSRLASTLPPHPKKEKNANTMEEFRSDDDVAGVVLVVGPLLFEVLVNEDARHWQITIEQFRLALALRLGGLRLDIGVGLRSGSSSLLQQ